MKSFDLAESWNYEAPSSVHYPSITIDSDLGDASVGDEITLIVKAKITAYRSDESGNKTTIDMQSAEVDETQGRTKNGVFLQPWHKEGKMPV